MSFVHLHCRSSFSLFEGVSKSQDLVTAARRLKMPALAITDRNALYGAVHFYVQAQKAGVKSVLGMEVDLDDNSSLVLLARNMDGYRNLCRLSSILRLNAEPDALPPAGFDGSDDEDEIPMWDRGIWGVPVFGFTTKPLPLGKSLPKSNFTTQNAKLPRELLLSGRYTRGLVALSGGSRGLVYRLAAEGKMQAAARTVGTLLAAFGEGNFFLEVTACTEHERQLIPVLATLAFDMGVPLVATNDVLYLEPADAAIASALASAKAGAKTEKAWTGNYAKASQNGKESSDETAESKHFASPEEMAVFFKEYPQALANSGFIADQCDVELPLHKPLFPSVDLGKRGEVESAFSKLWKLCFAGATRYYKPLNEKVMTRLKYELEVIEGLGFAPYFLVVYDIAQFARRKGIAIMARGSAANSLVAFVLGITQVDPLAYDLLFERFLNASRAEFELPDIDLDICWRRRDEVLHYVYERYGRGHVATVGTHITFRIRSAWRAMGKAVGIHPDRINRVAARLPHLFTVEDALEEGILQDVADTSDFIEQQEQGYQEEKPTSLRLRDEQEQKALDLCKAIEGLPRHMGMHCAALVIAPCPITDIVPLQRAARDANLAITQYEKDAIEALGLVKLDLLGSRALTTLVDTVQAAGLVQGKRNRDVHASLEAIPFDDPDTYRMMAHGDTLGCFQLESPGQRGLLKWLRPKSMDDIAASISLFRPGPMQGGFLELFMRRHLGQEPVSYPHPAMEPVLKNTYGVILYQEQFLRLAHTLAGLSLGEAEKLRKEIGKARSPEERTRLGSLFVTGCIERGIDQFQAEKVWEVISGYTGFGFCEAHAYSYGLAAYRSAFLKAHYPAQFLAAQINNQGGYYGPAVYVEDARRLKIELLPPHINHSGAWCEAGEPPKTRQIRFGLQFIKGLSERTISLILSERRVHGPFRSLQDLLLRVQMSQPEATSLVKVGACDGLGLDFNIDAWGTDLRLAHHTHHNLHNFQELPALNRKQLMWLLPTLINTRRPKLRSNGTSHSASHVFVGEPLQIVMGDMLIGNLVSPKILGRITLEIEVPDVEEYTLAEKLRFEREVLGFTVSRNEMELYAEARGLQDVLPSSVLAEYAGQKVSVAGVIAAGRKHLTKDGGWMLFISLQDAIGLIEVVLFPVVYKRYNALIANGGYGPFVITGSVQVGGKGRGGIQVPVGIRPSDAVALKTLPVIIAEEVRVFDSPSTHKVKASSTGF
jgi:DNA polymerase-3 subunit alpha